MFRSSIIRRYVSLAVLTSYLLVATLSGMFHDHGEECCTAASASAVPNCAASHSKTCAHHHHRGGHKHRHQAANCAKRSVEPNSPDRAHEQDSPPAQRVPLTHTDCAACQFLAQHSIPVAPVTLDAVEAIVPLATPGWPAHPPISVAKCHPARGPPCRG